MFDPDEMDVDEPVPFVVEKGEDSVYDEEPDDDYSIAYQSGWQTGYLRGWAECLRWVRLTSEERSAQERHHQIMYAGGFS